MLPVQSIPVRAAGTASPVVSASNVASSGKVKLSWEPVEGAVQYKVYRATSKTGSYRLMKTTTSTTYTNTSAEVGKAYWYKVKAIHSNENANSAYSSVKSRTCDLARPDVTIAVDRFGEPVLSWGAVKGAKEYKVYRAESKNGTYRLLKTQAYPGYTDTLAESGKRYCWISYEGTDENGNHVFYTRWG